VQLVRQPIHRTLGIRPRLTSRISVDGLAELLVGEAKWPAEGHDVNAPLVLGAAERAAIERFYERSSVSTRTSAERALKDL
jgi:hypothetical protein